MLFRSSPDNCHLLCFGQFCNFDHSCTTDVMLFFIFHFLFFIFLFSFFSFHFSFFTFHFSFFIFHFSLLTKVRSLLPAIFVKVPAVVRSLACFWARFGVRCGLIEQRGDAGAEQPVRRSAWTASANRALSAATTIVMTDPATLPPPSPRRGGVPPSPLPTPRPPTRRRSAWSV